jgi:hypothetical protein
MKKDRALGGFSLAIHDRVAAVIMAAMAADMVMALQLAAIRAFVIHRFGQRVMRPAHIPPRRRGFTFWDRHGPLLLKTLPGSGSPQKRQKAVLPKVRLNIKPA